MKIEDLFIIYCVRIYKTTDRTSIYEEKNMKDIFSNKSVKLGCELISRSETKKKKFYSKEDLITKNSYQQKIQTFTNSLDEATHPN